MAVVTSLELASSMARELETYLDQGATSIPDEAYSLM